MTWGEFVRTTMASRQNEEGRVLMDWITCQTLPDGTHSDIDGLARWFGYPRAESGAVPVGHGEPR